MIQGNPPPDEGRKKRLKKSKKVTLLPPPPPKGCKPLPEIEVFPSQVKEKLRKGYRLAPQPTKDARVVMDPMPQRRNSGRRSRSHDRNRNSDPINSSSSIQRQRPSSLRKKRAVSEEINQERSTLVLPPVQPPPLQRERPQSRRRRKSSASRSSSRDNSSASIEAFQVNDYAPTFHTTPPTSEKSDTSAINNTSPVQLNVEQKDVSPLAQSSPQIAHRQLDVVNFEESWEQASPPAAQPSTQPGYIPHPTFVQQPESQQQVLSNNYHAAQDVGDVKRSAPIKNVRFADISRNTESEMNESGVLNPAFEDVTIPVHEMSQARSPLPENTPGVPATSHKRPRKSQNRGKRARSQDATRMPPMFGISSDSIIFMDDTYDTDKYHLSSKKSFQLVFERAQTEAEYGTEI